MTRKPLRPFLGSESKGLGARGEAVDIATGIAYKYGDRLSG
jgi:hypothetical protein